MNNIWVYLEASPLLGLTLTLVVYVVAEALWRRANYFPLLHPVAVAIVAIVTILRATGTPYQTYFAGAQFVHVLLGPATVALAVPLYRNFESVRRAAIPIVVALITGSVTSIVSTVLIARALGASPIVIRSLAPKAVTTPIAMGISERIGGIPSLTAALVILAGITGAIATTIVFRREGDWAARGLGIGTAAHGIGTARALALSPTAGAFASIALGFNAILSSVLVPPLVALLAPAR